MFLLFFDHSFVPPAGTRLIPVRRRIFPSIECKVACHIGQQQKRPFPDLRTRARAYLLLFTSFECVPTAMSCVLSCTPRAPCAAAPCFWPVRSPCFPAVVSPPWRRIRRTPGPRHRSTNNTWPSRRRQQTPDHLA